MNVSYDDAGMGEPAVVLIHGWAFGNRSHLVPQFEHLSASRRVILLDLPGQGGSDRVPAGFGFGECAAAAARVVEAAGIAQAVLCGHSFGGRVAVELAAAHPERVAGIALVDPVLLFPAPVREQATRLASALESDGWRLALQDYFSALLSPDDPPDVRSKIVAELGGVDRNLGAQVMRAGMAADGSDALARVRCPVLVIRRPETPIDVERLQELQPQASVAESVGTGHWMTLSVPDQVNAVLDRFLGGLAEASPRSANGSPRDLAVTGGAGSVRAAEPLQSSTS
jgi:pimeloyl-ACP methyl ester carboxylesterase